MIFGELEVFGKDLHPHHFHNDAFEYKIERKNIYS